MTKQQIMTRAWELKRQDATNLFSECLREAWKESKKNYTFSVDFYAKKYSLFPYVAKINIVDGKINRDFVDLHRDYKRNDIHVYGKYNANENEVVEIRESGNWKVDYRSFYVVENGKLEKLCGYKDKKRVLEYFNVI